MPSEEDRLAITELFNKKQALMIELQHYEANASAINNSLDSSESAHSAMPTNTRLHVGVEALSDEVILLYPNQYIQIFNVPVYYNVFTLPGTISVQVKCMNYVNYGTIHRFYWPGGPYIGSAFSIDIVLISDNVQ